MDCDERIWRTLEPCSSCRCSRRKSDRRNYHLSPGGAAVYRQADRTGDELSPTRPSSRSRTRGCSMSAAARRAARIAAAADRDLRGAAGYQQLAWRTGAGVRCDAGRMRRESVRGHNSAACSCARAMAFAAVALPRYRPLAGMRCGERRSRRVPLTRESRMQAAPSIDAAWQTSPTRRWATRARSAAELAGAGPRIVVVPMLKENG